MKKPTMLVVVVNSHDGYFHEVLVDCYGRAQGGKFGMTSLAEAQKSARSMRRWLKENGHRTHFAKGTT